MTPTPCLSVCSDPPPCWTMHEKPTELPRCCDSSIWDPRPRDLSFSVSLCMCLSYSFIKPSQDSRTQAKKEHHTEPKDGRSRWMDTHVCIPWRFAELAVVTQQGKAPHGKTECLKLTWLLNVTATIWLHVDGGTHYELKHCSRTDHNF